MSDPFPSVIALGVLVLLAMLALGLQLVSILRDTDAWVPVPPFRAGDPPWLT